MPQKLIKVPMTPPEPAPVESVMPDYGLLESEYTEPYHAWKQAPGPKTMTPMLKAINPVLDSALRTYATKGSPTLRSQAKLLAAEAINKYDPTRSKLQTHLMYNLQGLRRASGREGQIIHLPERIGIDLFHLRQSEEELQDKLGRNPSSSELADHTGLSKRRIAYIRKAQPGMPESMIMQKSDEGEEQAPVGPAVRSPDSERIWQEFVHGDLTPPDQLIMEHTLGLFGQPVLHKKEIARRLNMSPGAVTQRATKIQEKLDKQEELNPLI